MNNFDNENYHKNIVEERNANKPQHTPTPWVTYGVRYSENVGIQPKKSEGRWGPVIENDGSINPEDAAFIVRAVNSHEELVNQLQACSVYLEAEAELQSENKEDNSTTLGLLKAVNQAITKAEGK